MDPGKNVAAEIRYEMRIITGPCKVTIRGVEHRLESTTDDMPVIVRITTSSNMAIRDERVVGVIGAERRGDTTEFIRIHSFLRAGGIIGLNRDLC